MHYLRTQNPYEEEKWKFAMFKMPSFFNFVWFDSLPPINNLSVIKGWVFLRWNSTKLGLMFLLKDIRQWRRWGSNPRPLGLESSTLQVPLSHCAPVILSKAYFLCIKYLHANVQCHSIVYTKYKNVSWKKWKGLNSSYKHYISNMYNNKGQ